MIQPGLPDDRRPPLTPQLAFRVTVIGGCALAMFAIIFFRLWFLQVLSGTQYVAQAKENRTRKVELPAPRGKIEDRNGTVLVASRRTTAVQIVPTDLPVPLLNPSISELERPPAKDRAVYNRLAGVLGIKQSLESCKVVGYQLVNGKSTQVTYHPRLPQISCDVAQAVFGLPYADARIATDVNPNILYYLSERHSEFPGVSEPEVNVTSYPFGTQGIASQVLGTVGSITSTEVKEAQYKGLPDDEVIGQTGLEAEYDAYLRGVNGAEKVEVDSEGDPIKSLANQPAIAGDTLKTSLDLKVQEAGQQSLQQSISSNAPPGAGGAFVAMDPQNGQVYGMGSLPTFNPNVFTKPISDTEFKTLFGPASGQPLDNRAIDGLYPTGSTFKVITATAALESGVWSLDQSYDDSGSFDIDGEVLHNSGHAAYGSVDLVSALKVSDDIFFYNLGALLNANPVTHPRGGALQTWARLYGLGHPTGVDLPYEASGLVPSPDEVNQLNNEERACEKRKHVSFCGISDLNPWTIGDNINTGVGQGDDLVTPLQLAVVYAAIENGGTVVRPHIGLQVENPIGDKLLQTIDPPPTRHVNINPTYLAAIQEGLREAASEPGGTSADVMASFPKPVYGKTGTAETFPNGIEEDQAWYACYVPATATSKPIVVVVTVEKGGFGAVAAAPVARQILSTWFFGKPGPYVAGTSTTL
jgi:penicillin-binding protein 2